MRNYAETGKRVFIGKFAIAGWNASNTKRPGVNSYFFTRPKRFRNVDPEAGCDVKVGLEARLRSHNLMIGVVRDQSHDATSESVVGRRAKLLNGFVENTSGRPAYNFPSGSASYNHQRCSEARKFLV
jgi:hypothetical protein